MLKPLLFGVAFALTVSISPAALAQASGKNKSGSPPPVEQTTPDQPPAQDEETPPPLPGEEGGLSEAALELRAYLVSQNKETLQILEDRYAADISRIESTLDRLLDNAQADFDREEALEGFAEVIAAERSRVANLIPQAPDASLRAAVAGLEEFMRKVYEQQGPEVCGRFADSGSDVLYEEDLAEAYAEDLDRQSALFLAAAADARDQPQTHGTANDQDLGVLFNRMLAQGGTEHQLDVLAAQNPADPEVCPALLGMLGALSTLDGPEGTRARAYFLPEFVGY